MEFHASDSGLAQIRLLQLLGGEPADGRWLFLPLFVYNSGFQINEHILKYKTKKHKLSEMGNNYSQSEIPVLSTYQVWIYQTGWIKDCFTWLKDLCNLNPSMVTDYVVWV